MRRLLHRLRRDEHGFTIVEVMVAASLLMVGLVGTMQMVDVANEKTVVDQGREGATNLAREVVEGANHVPYEQLTPTGTVAALQALPNLGSTGGPGWTVERRGFTYTIVASACTVDDKVDGFRAPGAAGSYCAESNQTDASTAQDRNGDDFRRATVTVSWELQGRTRTVTQTTIVNNPGDAAGPAVTELSADRWSPVTTPGVTQIVLTAETTEPPRTSETTKVKISIDGSFRGNATKVGEQWRYTWSGINTLPDATYIITAQAYDADGRSRGVRLLKMILNRGTAVGPATVTAGRNVRLKASPGGPSIIDLAWVGSNEPDVVGYRVYRRVAGTSGDGSLVCETSLEAVKYGTTWTSFAKTKDPLSCSDATAGLVDAQAYEYSVRPLDSDPLTGAVREAQAIGWDAVPGGVAQPPAPATLTRTIDTASKTVRLDWPQPTLPAGVTVDHYRIYRAAPTDAIPDLVDRYDRTGGTERTWTDNQIGAGGYRYWVVTVSKATSSGGYSESDPVGPVTG